ncbi:MAG: SulP family inorganic anion transporter [Caldilineaceae bacterium]
MLRKNSMQLALFRINVPDNLLAGITAGLVVGMILTFLNVSMAALIFKGALTPYLADGISLVLSGTVVLVLVTAMLSSLPSVVCVVQEAPVGILAVVAADIVYAMRGYNPDQIYATVLGAILVSTGLTALTFWLLGRFQLGQLVRFVPYPVIGGFLAGTGWRLVTGALQVMTGTTIAAALLDPLLLLRWIPGLLFGLLIFFTLRRTAHFLALPTLVMGAITIFYLALVGLGYTPDDALAAGWLLGPLPAGQLWQPGALLALRGAAWPLILTEHGASLAAIPLMSILALLLNTGALEVALGRDADVNRELRAGGIANVLALLAGSPPGFVAVTESALGQRLGGGGRLRGVVIAAVSVATLLFGATFLAYIPRLVVGGLLAFLGFVFLFEWLYDAWFKLMKLDNLLIWLITIVIALFGFLAGVAVGILVAMVLFVINYSRVDALRHFYSRTDYPSYVSRPRCMNNGCTTVANVL